VEKFARITKLALLSILLLTPLAVAGPAEAASINSRSSTAHTDMPSASTTQSPGLARVGTRRVDEGGTTVRVCSPKKCVTAPASSFCPVSRSGCGILKFTPNSGYCSPSVGCVTIAGKNYTMVGDIVSASQRSAIGACLASLGLTAASASAGGPVGWAIAGLAVTAWGCSTIS